MSLSSSPQSDDRARRRDRPPALALLADSAAVRSSESARQTAVDVYDVEHDDRKGPSDVPHVASSSTLLPPSGLSDARSNSSNSSLDPYYFSSHSPPHPPITPENNDYASSSDNASYAHRMPPPVTPARDPASIDRRGLIGVGELATPRWLTRHDLRKKEWRGKGEGVQEEREDEPALASHSHDTTEDERGSPWTIEAIDADIENAEDSHEQQSQHLQVVHDSPSGFHTIKSKASMDESGGEEILYPRRIAKPDPADLIELVRAAHPQQLSDASTHSTQQALAHPPRSPPSHSKSKKRASDDLLEQSGTLASKSTGSPITSRHERDDKATRRHRSLGVSVPSTSSTRERERVKDRRRAEGVALSLGGIPKSVSASVSSPTARERHTRHTSASSTSSVREPRHSHQQTDYSHLPPSPSIQTFLNTTTSTPPLPSLHSSPSVAHSLLRGTQEGWSGLDDSATAEALRKLDGISGKTLRSRSSIIGPSGSRGNSRAGTPGGVKSGQWEGIERTPSLRRKNSASSNNYGMGGVRMDRDEVMASGDFVIDDESAAWPASARKTAHKEPVTPGSARSSFAVPPAKRSSASSTTFTGTSSRDSTGISVGTSMTSTSGRQSGGKLRRTNSVGSDVSSVHSFDATSQKDRAAALAATGDQLDDEHLTSIPPVPPIPKEYKSPQPSSSGSTSTHFIFPPAPSSSTTALNDFPPSPTKEDDADRTVIIPTIDIPTVSPPRVSPAQPPYPHKSPSKKWSFSGALNLLPSHKASSPRSPKAQVFNTVHQVSARETHHSPQSSDPWSPIEHQHVTSASTSSSSLHLPHSPSISSLTSSKTPDRNPSRSGTASSASNHTTSAQAGGQAPMSPSKRASTSKRLTPSAIPFFRRSSSHSINIHNTSVLQSTSPTHQPGPSEGFNSDVPTTPPSASEMVTPMASSKKQSVFGLQSLLKSSSRKSLHVDKSSGSESKSKDKEREREEKEKKKDDKDRSESRISVLMGRKRGKTISSSNDPKKSAIVAPLPPMNMSALPSSTAQRVASLKASPVPSTPTKGSVIRSTASVISNMGKSSDTSLRSSRHILPPIAGSPSVGNANRDTIGASGNTGTSLPSNLVKETPTKIPRISSRTSATGSPQRRTSLNIAPINTPMHTGGSSTSSMGPQPSPPPMFADEFGQLENKDASFSKTTIPFSQRMSLRSSPQNVPRQPRQLPVPSSSVPSTVRKTTRDSISFSGLRKSSTASISSMSSALVSTESHPTHSRLSILSPSKSVKLLTPKISIPTPRASASHATSSVYGNGANPAAASIASSSRQSLSTPSPVPSSVDDEEILGDEEMMAYIKRQQARKLASGAKKEDLDELLKFPEPLPPAAPSSPNTVLKSNQNAYLSDYERKEILDYPQVYYIGARSDKKPATRDNTHNNHSYDDDRGDYLVVNHDHLAYRYEIIDTLGKGSFGQVLHCRDHCTGESVAIKIIRNKKRFHHQALVEIKILDNLRKWDPDEKHHVIKMTEHFYFRNHLCIAMELLSINLYELIKANGFVGFTTTLIRRFTSQMLMSLALMRHHRIVHCDLKPENVLLRHPAKSGLKVIDFGSSCLEHEKVYTYIQSRFYRSPEVILGMNYHMAIDMWSLGCILAELYTGFPIFPGENEQEQLSCIMEVLGLPDKDLINRSSRKKLFFDSTGAPRPVVNSKGRRRRPGTKTLAQVLRCDDENFVDFIAKCLIWDPERRMKPQPAMRHPFLTAGRRPKPPTSPAPPSTSRSLLASSTASLSSRSKPTETPKKSLIGAPTPLTARRTTASSGVPTTPSVPGSGHTASGSSSHRSYRTSQPPSVSYHHSSSRTLSGQTNNVFATVPAKLS